MKKTGLRAGAAKVNITPPVGVPQAGFGHREKRSDSIDDELYSKALVFADDNVEVAIVTNDLIGVNAELVKKVRGLIHQRIGIPEGNVLICASHTHYGPMLSPHPHLNESMGEPVDSEWVEVLTRKMAGAVLMAHNSLREVKVGAGKGQVGEIVYNRRTKQADGKVQMSWFYPSPETDLQFGPTDPEVGVLRIDDSNHQVVATLVNFACHPVFGGDNLYAISADYPGHAMGLIERIAGGICLFTLGAAGNINPVLTGGTGGQRTGIALGAEALKVIKLIEVHEGERLWAKREIVSLPLKPFPSSEELQKEIDETKDLFSRLQKEQAADDVIIAAKDRLRKAQYVLSQVQESGVATTVESEVQIIGIDDVLLVGLPGEIFVEIGLKIKESNGDMGAKGFPPSQNHPLVFPVSCANDSVGYIPTTEAYDEGGYEQDWTKIGPGADKATIDVALRLMED